MRKAPTEEQKQKAAERRHTLNELAKKLQQLTKDEQTALLQASGGQVMTVDGHPLSEVNSLMVLNQFEGKVPTIVGGYQQWRKQGRQVRKGSMGMGIWVPSSKKETMPNGEEVEKTRFLSGTVFDITQTDPINPVVEVNPEPDVAVVHSEHHGGYIRPGAGYDARIENARLLTVGDAESLVSDAPEHKRLTMHLLNSGTQPGEVCAENGCQGRLYYDKQGQCSTQRPGCDCFACCNALLTCELCKRVVEE